MRFSELLKIELMKYRRSKIIPLIFIAPILVVSSGIANLSAYFTPEYTNAWPTMFIQSALLYAYYLLPFSMIVVCVMIASQETNHNGLLKMMSLPVSRQALSLAKFCILIFYLFMEIFVFLAADHAVRHIRIQIDFQILIPLDFIFQRRHLGVIVDDAPLLLRQRCNVIQHLFHLGNQLNMVVYYPENDGFQLVLAECMRGTAPTRFVGGTDQVMILFPAAGDSLPNHGMFAIAAEHEAGEEMHLFLLRSRTRENSDYRRTVKHKQHKHSAYQNNRYADN